jgi:hypothetical protein
MATFTLDTSGAVEIPNSGGQVRRGWLWSDLSPFTQGYVEALFAEWAESLDEQGEALLSWRRGVDRVCFSDLAPATLAAILKDCGPDSRGYVHPTGATMGIANSFEGGGLFWRTRQEGMWAGFPPLTAYLGDDGLIYLREGA